MRVSLLTTTPVKSLTVHHPDHVDLSQEGVVGDRAFFLVDEAGELVGCTKDGDLLRYSAAFDPDASVLEVHGPGGLVRSAPVVETGAQVGVSFYGLRTVTSHVIEGWDEVFSEAVGRPTRLVRGESGGFDVHGVTLLGTSTLEALAAANSSDPVDPRRFRLNIQIDGSEPLAEDTWAGRHLRIGAAVVEVGGPVKRCAATTRNPETGESDLRTLQMIGAYRGRQETPDFGVGFYLGVYADVVVPGRVRVGDEVALVDTDST